MSADNNPMVLVELTGLSYRYGATIYPVDGVNGPCMEGLVEVLE